MNSLYQRISPIKYAKRGGVKIGENCKLINPDFGSEPWLITIGDHVEITNGVKFITHDGATWVFRNDPKYSRVRKFGKIIVKNNCFIGLNAIILPNIIIGPNSIVAAGSIVTKDVPPNSVVAGNPAKIICSMQEYADKCLANTPLYDEKAYKLDRKGEILRMLNETENLRGNE